jgi:hypothetical protein
MNLFFHKIGDLDGEPTRYWRKGSIDYSKIEELRTKDLEQYRGPARPETRIVVQQS